MKIMDMMGLGSGEATTYIESDKPFGMKVGDEVPAVLKITKTTEEDHGGRTIYAIEAEIVKIKGKASPEKKKPIEDEIEEGLEEAFDDEGKPKDSEEKTDESDVEKTNE